MRDLVGFQKFTTDKRGLKAYMRINLDKQVGRETYSDLKMAESMNKDIGLSIGYKVIKDEFDRDSGVRHLKELALYESSFTLFPMNDQASVTMVKSNNAKITNELLEIKEHLDSLLSDKPSKDTYGLEAELREIKQTLKQLRND
jgi:phage head maturation protease